MRQRVPARQKALDLLARRSHFERELELKLVKRSYERAEIAETLERLRSDGLLDDARTARELVRSRLARGPIGRARLRADLGRRGVASEIVDEVISELTPDDDTEPAREAAARWVRTRWRPGKDAERQRASLARHLAGRGFSRRAIFSVLDEIGDEAQPPDP